MNQIIIDAIACPMCDAPKGTECTREGGCGMRLDDFCRDAPRAERQAVHHETEEYFKEHEPDLVGSPSMFLSAEEQAAYDKFGPVKGL